MKTEHGNYLRLIPRFSSARYVHVNKLSMMEWLDKVCEIPLNSFSGSELSFTLWANGYANKKNEFRDSMLETAKFPLCLVSGISPLTF